jgi:hypothetical protein
LSEMCAGRLHRTLKGIILNAYAGPRPTGLVARHLNDIKDDNRPDNLAWGTQLDNMKDCQSNGKVSRGEAIPNSKLSAQQVKTIRHMHKEGHSQSMLARLNGVKSCTIRNVLKGITWVHVA